VKLTSCLQTKLRYSTRSEDPMLFELIILIFACSSLKFCSIISKFVSNVKNDRFI